MSGWRFLLDTNVMSEMFKSHPDRRVAGWFQRTDPGNVYISVVSLGEIKYGVARLPLGKRRTALEAWAAETLPSRYQGRVLSFEQETAAIWGELMYKSERSVGSRNAIDMQLAATAVQHCLVIVTRNSADFASPDLGLDLVNPWIEMPPTVADETRENTR
jgi:predicted nucleic acid-binding protein